MWPKKVWTLCDGQTLTNNSTNKLPRSAYSFEALMRPNQGHKVENVTGVI